MIRKPNIHGGGSNTNKNGLKFEGRTDFINSIKNNKNFFLNKLTDFKNTYEIDFKKQKIGYYTEKYEFYNFFYLKKKLIGERLFPNNICLMLYL